MSKNKTLPLMPKATAIWLVDNTSLTFKQIANFCGLHELEIQGIADGDVAKGIHGENPIDNGQLTKDEIDRCVKDSNLELRINISEAYEKVVKSQKKTAKYTPVARRQDKPDAIFWLLKNFPGITDAQIGKLIGTTKNTAMSIRDKTHWNMANIRSRDPVLLGICTQRDLDKVIEKVKHENPESDSEEA